MQELAPIVLFVYNRPWHTRQTIKSLKQNELAQNSMLYIFSDGPKSASDRKSVDEVRKIIKTVAGFKTVNIILRDKNLGLANSVISGVSEIIKKYERVIVVEDDMIFSESFLEYMNKILFFYQHDMKVFSVSGYNFPISIPSSYKNEIYFSPRTSSWGWATWQNRWDKADWNITDFNNFIIDRDAVRTFNHGGDDLTLMLKKQVEGKIDSWAVRWCYAHYKNQAYCVYPIKSLVMNIGTDRTGTHFNKTKKYNVKLSEYTILQNLPESVFIDDQILKSFQNFFKKSILQKFYNNLKRVINL
jgi:hypothetical protein